ncbi:helix-turn-helix domain-containing protein [Actinomadura decatromicini]|uniref:Helix-turn-helix transcriptional regulator n=1 Tax=Actinomadura decatromicini TaxID=2604572 RepID=A0A5D3FAW3_9ACTN|nr:helix-turn-helix transcriptional regulator [Actinomadura decatromicini]TYK45229.1 helix-turn-helix transcriptional regulator [Actinomadura decatromicini]
MAKSDWPVERFIDTLDRVIKETGLSQVELAALVPMDQSQFSRWKSGGSRPRYESLLAFARAIEEHHPNLSIKREEILAAGGYADATRMIAPNGNTAAHSVHIPGDVHLSALEPWEQHIWFTPDMTVEQRRGLIRFARLERGELTDDLASLLKLSDALNQVVARHLRKNLKELEDPPAAG